MLSTGGEGGIRTHDTLARIPVFETGPFNHSGTSPREGAILNDSRHAGTLILAALTALLLACADWAAAQRTLAPEVEDFIAEMAGKHRFEADALRRSFMQVQPRQAILRAIATPSTALPWHEFRARNVDAARINSGGAFWREHATVLARANREYGVPEELIVATLGIETLYGRNTGRFRVLESLSTLAFHYPPREALFRAELEEFLLLAREAGLNLLNVNGSYAGAIGIPQFLPSSYRRYAVDFDGDGKRDLMGTVADAIGSVANYYRSFGWRTGDPVVVPAQVSDRGLDGLLDIGTRPHRKVGEWRRLGVMPVAPVEEGEAAALFVVETESGPRYWLGLNNFYVITRYNRSVNYALAVHELARELRAQFRPGD